MLLQQATDRSFDTKASASGLCFPRLFSTALPFDLTGDARYTVYEAVDGKVVGKD
jgi:hypothetical protein